MLSAPTASSSSMRAKANSAPRRHELDTKARGGHRASASCAAPNSPSCSPASRRASSPRPSSRNGRRSPIRTISPLAIGDAAIARGVEFRQAEVRALRPLNDGVEHRFRRRHEPRRQQGGGRLGRLVARAHRPARRSHPARYRARLQHHAAARRLRPAHASSSSAATASSSPRSRPASASAARWSSAGSTCRPISAAPRPC